jgi:hypothetical protein
MSRNDGGIGTGTLERIKKNVRGKSRLLLRRRLLFLPGKLAIVKFCIESVFCQ